MALGNNYDNNKKDFQPTVYSPYRMSNVEGIDPSALGFSFWAGLLKISIAPVIKSNNDTPSFDYKNAGTAYITHTKAKIFADEIDKFMASPDTYNNVGVDTKGGLISLSNGKEFGISNPCLVIRKVNETSGDVDATYVYEFKTAYHNSIRNFDEKSKKFDAYLYKNLEIEQLKIILEQYYTHMTYAAAYSVVDSSKFENSRVNTKIGLIAEKLGVEFKGSKDGGGSSNKSFFNNNSSSNGGGSKGFDSATIDDIAGMMDEE